MASKSVSNNSGCTLSKCDTLPGKSVNEEHSLIPYIRPLISVAPELSKIMSMGNYLSSPCFSPIKWWIKSSPPGVVFTNFTKSTAVATTYEVDRAVLTHQKANSMYCAIYTNNKSY